MHTSETKAKISATRQKVAREKRLKTAPPPKKRCTRCNQLKNTEKDFTRRSRKLISGERVYYPSPHCKECDAKRRREWRASMTEEERKAMYARDRPKDKEALRRYQREWATISRRKQGVEPRGPWKKYRDDSRDLVDKQPLIDWLYEQFPVHTNESIALQAGLADESRIRKIKHPSTKRIEIALVDKICVGLGYPEMTILLYPVSD